MNIKNVFSSYDGLASCRENGTRRPENEIRDASEKDEENQTPFVFGECSCSVLKRLNTSIAAHLSASDTSKLRPLRLPAFNPTDGGWLFVFTESFDGQRPREKYVQLKTLGMEIKDFFFRDINSRNEMNKPFELGVQ